MKLTNQLLLSFPQARDGTFENFILEETNERLIAVLKRFIEDDSADRVVSVTLRAGKGSGKTHLLSALAGRAKSSLYFPSPKILSERAARSEKPYAAILKFIARRKEKAFVAFDDIESICEDESAQNRLVHIYNCARADRARLGFAIETIPDRWRFNDHLKTRLLWGLTLEPRPLSASRRIEIFKRAATTLDMSVPPNALKFIERRLPRDPASLVRLAESINQISLEHQRKVTIDLVKVAVADKDK